MDVRQIAQDYLVAGQIGPDHVPAIARAGIKAIVCNRPDFEPGAVPHEVVRQAAERAGLEFHYIPVDHQVGITHENIAATVRVITGTAKPVLAYCRSGARSANLYNYALQTR